jgi:uncharacterized membrane protein YhaH (DUF805 family)
MAIDQVQLVKDALKSIREAKRPTFWQVSGEIFRMLLPTVLLCLCGHILFNLNFPLFAGIIWMITAVLLSLQILVTVTSIIVRRRLFELRDSIDKINKQ